MNVLVIGGTRFLGYHLIQRLLNEGTKVVLFNRGIHPDDFGDKVERVVGDRKDYKKFYDTFHRRQFDVVVDLIGYDPDDVEVAVKTLKNNIGQYIFISTGQVYLVTKNKHLPSAEKDYYQDIIECPPGEEAAYLYGIRKRHCEDFLEEAFKFQHFPSVRFRCPIIHGERDYTLRLYSYLLRMLDENPLIIPESSDPVIRHVYVKDVVDAIFSVLQVEQTRGKVYNLASEEVLVLAEFLQLASRFVEKPLTIYKIPATILRQNEIPPEISPFSSKWISYLDPSLAQEETNFKPTPIYHWLRETIHWFMYEYDGPEPENFNNRQKEIALAEWWRRKKA
jgi:nucleoside-diphosphate-sugar epimerase